MERQGCKDYGKITENFYNLLQTKTFVHFDIVEVTDSSSVTPTIDFSLWDPVDQNWIPLFFCNSTSYRTMTYDFLSIPTENETETRFLSETGVFRIVSGQILCSWRSRVNYA